MFSSLREKHVSQDTCAEGVAQATDVLALVIRFCVQLLLKRGDTTPSSVKKTKDTRTHSDRTSAQNTNTHAAHVADKRAQSQNNAKGSQHASDTSHFFKFVNLKGPQK